jgi:hypothetical protein
MWDRGAKARAIRMTDNSVAEQRQARRLPVPAECQGAILRWQDVDRPATVVEQSAGGLAVCLDGACDLQSDAVATLSWTQSFCRVRVVHRQEQGDVVRLGLVRLEELYSAADMATPGHFWPSSSLARPQFRSHFWFYAITLFVLGGGIVALAWEVMPSSGALSLQTPVLQSRRSNAENPSVTAAARRRLAEATAINAKRQSSNASASPPSAPRRGGWIDAGASTATGAVDQVVNAVSGAADRATTSSQGLAKSTARAMGTRVVDAAETLLLALPRHKATLQLSSTQQKRIDAILRQSQDAMQTVYRQSAELGTQEVMSKVATIRRQAGEQVFAALSPAQSAKLRKLESGPSK